MHMIAFDWNRICDHETYATATGCYVEKAYGAFQARWNPCTNNGPWGQGCPSGYEKDHTGQLICAAYTDAADKTRRLAAAASQRQGVCCLLLLKSYYGIRKH